MLIYYSSAELSSLSSFGNLRKNPTANGAVIGRDSASAIGIASWMPASPLRLERISNSGMNSSPFLSEESSDACRRFPVLCNSISVVIHGGSAKDASDKPEISYIPKPTIASVATMEEQMETDVAVPTRLDAAFIYQIAALVMVAFREEVAKSLFSIAQQYLLSTLNRE